MSPHIPIVYEEEQTRWKYKRMARNLEKEEPPTERELDELGEQGWELCGIFTSKSFAHFYFKRFSK